MFAQVLLISSCHTYGELFCLPFQVEKKNTIVQPCNIALEFPLVERLETITKVYCMQQFDSNLTVICF